MQTINFFMNNSILLTELLSYFHIFWSWRKRKKRHLFCIKFLITSWLCLVLAMCREKLCGCTILIIMKHWWKMPPKHFSVLITRFTMVVYLYNVKYFFVVKKGGQGGGMSHQNWGWGGERMNIWFQIILGDGRMGGLIIA